MGDLPLFLKGWAAPCCLFGTVCQSRAEFAIAQSSFDGDLPHPSVRSGGIEFLLHPAVANAWGDGGDSSTTKFEPARVPGEWWVRFRERERPPPATPIVTQTA
eukprot:Hpha_TRINITY_DN34560_c0_g1::TRINITY_DN34560_c0_g1_i1::g.96329::m.96329